jgi:glycosyltransferase involved in cell wall biosynthesis
MKVSVIVAIYNLEQYLDYCIESLTIQDYRQMEIILVDDGSTDRSPLLCDEWAKRDSRIKVVHKSNSGLSGARNVGLDVATGTYVLFVDGDDYLVNGAITTLVEIMKINKVDFVQFGYEEVQGYEGLNDTCNTRLEEMKRSLKTMFLVYDRKEMFRQLYVLGGVAASACTKFMCLETAHKLRFKEGILHEDEQFTTRLLAQANSVCYVNDFLPYKYVMRQGSIIHTAFKSKKLYDLSEMYEERLEILRAANFKEVLPTTASAYWRMLILLFGESQKASDEAACSFIRTKVRQLLAGNDLQLLGVNRVIAYLYKWGMPGLDIYYGIRKLLGK